MLADLNRCTLRLCGILLKLKLLPGSDAFVFLPFVCLNTVCARFFNLCTSNEQVPDVYTFSFKTVVLVLRAAADVFAHNVCSRRLHWDLTAPMPLKTARGPKRRHARKNRYEFQQPADCQGRQQFQVHWHYCACMAQSWGWGAAVPFQYSLPYAAFAQKAGG